MENFNNLVSEIGSASGLTLGAPGAKKEGYTFRPWPA